MTINIQKIKEIQFLLIKNTALEYKRFLYDKIDYSQKLSGIIGPRGVGKTTLILQYLKENHAEDEKALYFTADSVLLKEGDLFGIADEFYHKHGGRLLCIDEIHRYPNWNQELKNIYDTLPKMRVIFSGSSSLNLIKGRFDLSRRGVLYKLPGLSFREYLVFFGLANFKTYSLESIVKNSAKISREIAGLENILMHFNAYLASGYYPFAKETQNKILYYQQINNVIDKAIYEDIAGFYKLKTENLIVFKKILHFLTAVTPGKFSINRLANSLGKNHATISEYLEILHETGLIRFFGNKKSGHALIRHAKKVFLDNTNLALALGETLGQKPLIGTQRELFALNQLENSGLVSTYPDKGDLSAGEYVFEIGGKNKNFSQIGNDSKAFLLSDDILIADRRKIPLYLFGFLY